MPILYRIICSRRKNYGTMNEMFSVQRADKSRILLDYDNELKNRYLHVDYVSNNES